MMVIVHMSITWFLAPSLAQILPYSMNWTKLSPKWSYNMNPALDAFRMIQDIRSQPGQIGKWGAALNIPQLIGGLIFIFTIEGLAILVAELVALGIAGQIHKRERFSRLISICHLPWVLLLPWLIWRLTTVEHGLILSIWLVYVTVTIAISLVFDVRELLLFRKGDRRFAWAR